MSKFMSYQDRLAIEKGLTAHKSFGKIGKGIGKDRTTIAKEVKKYSYEKKSGCRLGRSYEDIKNYMEQHPDIPAVEMDSVIGSKGGKDLLKIHFVDTSLMLAFLRDSNTSQSVTHLLDAIFRVLGRECFQKLFPVILTDNGSEFSNPKAIEYGPEQKDLLRTRIFYCDPSNPYQKGSIEVNHELIRRILPKSTLFDDLTQKDIFLMMNHINSYMRKKLNGRRPDHWLADMKKKYPEWPDKDLHTLRHTALTNMLLDGVPISEVSKAAGHAQQSTTLNTYSHVIKHVRRRGVEAAENYIEQLKNKSMQ